jgi:hypothetical protein
MLYLNVLFVFERHIFKREKIFLQEEAVEATKQEKERKEEKI